MTISAMRDSSSRPLFFFTLDIDFPADQFRRQANVLPPLADGERELQIVDDHFHVLLESGSTIVTREIFAGLNAWVTY